MANQWTKFKKLLPRDALQVGEVVQIDGDKSKMKLPTDETIWISGSNVQVGKNAYFKGGQITGEAPDLEVKNVTVY